jgi:hypothetical protein
MEYYKVMHDSLAGGTQLLFCQDENPLHLDEIKQRIGIPDTIILEFTRLSEKDYNAEIAENNKMCDM